MNKKHNKLVTSAEDSIGKVFGDTTVSRAETAESIMRIKNYCNDLLETLAADEADGVKEDQG